MNIRYVYFSYQKCIFAKLADVCVCVCVCVCLFSGIVLSGGGQIAGPGTGATGVNIDIHTRRLFSTSLGKHPLCGNVVKRPYQW